jgi:hypothetical protein
MDGATGSADAPLYTTGGKPGNRQLQLETLEINAEIRG